MARRKCYEGSCPLEWRAEARLRRRLSFLAGPRCRWEAWFFHFTMLDMAEINANIDGEVPT